MKVLLVEDRTGQARKDDDQEVIICKGAFAALQAIYGIDVVFLDNGPPYAQGMDPLQKIRNTEDLANLKVVISTAEEENDSFKTLGADDCIHKPFNKDELYRVLNEYKK